MKENIMHFSKLMLLLFLLTQISLVLSRDIGLENDLYEGDIAVRTSLPLNSSSSVKLAALRDISKTWPGGKIPYRIDTDSIPNQNDQDLILAAMATLTRKVSCIEFQDNDLVQRFDYVRIAGDGDKSHSSSGCWSYLGMQGGEQTLNLGTGCFTEEIILHEFLHLLGFIHEQNRPDRDDFVDIIWSNVQPGMKKQFEKRNENDVNMQDTPYDFRSRMHYPAESFSKSNAPTIVAHHPGNDNFGPLDKLSATDVVEISLLYRCPIQSNVLVSYNHANRYANEVRIDQVWDEIDAINGTTEAKFNDIDENMEDIKVKVDSCDAQMKSVKELLENISIQSSEMKSEITELKAKNEKLSLLNTELSEKISNISTLFHTGYLVSARASSQLESSKHCWGGSNWCIWGPQFAIDGLIQTTYGKIFHSNTENYPWFEVELRYSTKISSVTIHNRPDCCGERFKNAEIRAGMTRVPDGTIGQLLNINTVCGTYRGPGANGGEMRIDCTSPIMAKFITVQLKDINSILQINEIRINING